MGGYGYQDQDKKSILQNERSILRLFGARNLWDFLLYNMKVKTKRMTTLKVYDYDLERNELVEGSKEFLKTLENC